MTGIVLPFFTVGHSDRSLAAFAALLEAHHIDRVVDVRAFPRSRSNPQFNIETLPGALAARGLGYEHLAALGGRRGKSPDVPPELNGFWTNPSFHNYADYALSAPFQAGLTHLLEAGGGEVCIMCSEALWWRCHRRIVADYLLARGAAVFHIMDETHLEAARLTPGALVPADGTVVYPAA